jgi:hypothetical protein
MRRRSQAQKHNSVTPAAPARRWLRVPAEVAEDFGLNLLPTACLMVAAIFIWFAGEMLFPEVSMPDIDAKEIIWLCPKNGASFVISEMAARQVWSAAITAQTLAFLFAICYFASSLFSIAD